NGDDPEPFLARSSYRLLPYMTVKVGRRVDEFLKSNGDTRIGNRSCRFAIALKSGKRRGSVSEPVRSEAHAVHERQVKATEFAVVIAAVRVIENAARGQRASQAANQEQRDLARIVPRPGPHV